MSSSVTSAPFRSSLGEAQALLESGRAAVAEARLDALLTQADADDQRARALFLRALARMAQHRPAAAVEDFDRVLALDPDALPARLNRGVALWRAQRIEEALAAFVALAGRAPGLVDAHYNAGLVELELGRTAEALAHLEQAARLAPGRADMHRSLGNALSEDGRADAAGQAFARAHRLAPRDPRPLCDWGMSLLTHGRPDQARLRLEAALARDRQHRAALAGLYLAAAETGDRTTAEALMDYAALLGRERVAFREAGLDAEALRAAVLGHPELYFEPHGKTTRKGEQSAFLDLEPGSPFHALGQAVAGVVGHRLRQPALARLMAGVTRWRLQMWATILREGGHQEPHIHPAGRLSGVWYLDPGAPADPDGGAIEFGVPPAAYGLAGPFVDCRLQPEEGQLVTFPSYFFHHTVPYRGPRPRISLAFDVVPVAGPSAG